MADNGMRATPPGPLFAPEETHTLLVAYMQAQTDLTDATAAADEAQQKADNAMAALSKADEDLTRHFEGLKAQMRLSGKGEGWQ